MSEMLRLYATLPKTSVLGPYSRFAIWVQGCTRSCNGCMTPEAQSLTAGEWVEIDKLASQIVGQPDIEGMTISGGEPFDQADALVRLIQRVRSKRDLGVIVYSGYVLNELVLRSETNEGVRNLMNSIDLLIDGPYIKELDDGKSLRGSSNQKIHPLTSRYKDVMDAYYGTPERRVELHLKHKEVFLVGIPGAEVLEKWKKRFAVQRTAELCSTGCQHNGRLIYNRKETNHERRKRHYRQFTQFRIPADDERLSSD